MAVKKDDDAWIGGLSVLMAAVSASIGVGYIFGVGFGWLAFAAFCVVTVFKHHLRTVRERA